MTPEQRPLHARPTAHASDRIVSGSPGSRSQLLTRAEVAQVLTVAEHTLANWRSRGFGPRCFRIGGVVRYHRDDVEHWLAEQHAATAGGSR